MLVKGTGLLLRLRRWLSRSEWAVRLLQLPRTGGEPDDRGLVMIQIDGLSRRQLEKAVAAGRMPFLKRLLRREHYRLASLYSGIPSSTPSVQGELFYGVRCATPAFSFYSGDLNRQVAMAEPEASQAVEARISADSQGLLDGGSAYCNVYTGGARESHFCARNLGLGGFLRSVSPLRLLIVSTWHLGSLVRAAWLTLLELCLAIGGFLTGGRSRHEFVSELQFIPARVAVVILLRELVTIGVALDVARGVPIVHANLLGYDEQAHRRGPESDFAHWTLRGVDNAIRKIWRAAHRSGARHYDVWIYSDHGQETTTPYPQRCGRTLQQAVAELMDNDGAAAEAAAGTGPTDRAGWLGTGRLARAILRWSSPVQDSSGAEPLVVANGPVGLVYPRRSLSSEQKKRLARRLVADAGCPLVLIAGEADTALAFDNEGEHRLPDDAAAVLGGTHPFRDAVAGDLVRLAHHPEAGSLVVCGGDKRGDSLSFAAQHGAHAGAGPEETHAFVLTPADAPMPHPRRGFLRPSDLRDAAIDFFNGGPSPPPAVHTGSPERSASVRIMTYNVHGCRGMDNRLSPARIARVIARSRPDIVALQELDVRRRRSDGVDQAHRIAHELEMTHHFHAAWSLEEEQFGDAVLCRRPMRLIKAGPLPGPERSPGEPRGAVWVEATVYGHRLQVINTHLGVTPGQRRAQLNALLGDDWLLPALRNGPLVLCGDFNLGPRSPRYPSLCEHLVDAQQTVTETPTHATWPTWRPVTRIDHIFATPDLAVLESHVANHRLARDASDHLPVVATFTLRAPAAVNAGRDDEVAVAGQQPR